ncbi:MAG: YhbY family RNA-binding protein [Legionellaceae bacterium]|nr:YhbY family RNA-binding protein [Legionellaceae bacterium]
MNKQMKNRLKAAAHHLNPVIIVGSKGVTDALIGETNEALQAHELIKIKVNAEDKAAREALVAILCEALGAELIQLIGHIAIVYRKKRVKA